MYGTYKYGRETVVPFVLKIQHLTAMISVKNVRYIQIWEWDSCTLCHSHLL